MRIVLVTTLAVSIGLVAGIQLAGADGRSAPGAAIVRLSDEPFVGEAGRRLPAGKTPDNGGTMPELAGNPQAQDLAPDALMHALALEIVAILKQPPAFPADPGKIAGLLETSVLPLFDFARLTQIAVARNWSQATPGQQAALIAEFRKFLVRTCVAALLDYRDQIIEFKKLRIAPGDTEVTVKSDVRQPGKERTSVDYDMEKTPSGWKVYDIKISGVSLVMTYRESFAGKVRDGGMDGLIKSLADNNQRDDSRIRPEKASSWKMPFLAMFALVQSALRGSR